MTVGLPELEPAPVHLRHIKPALSTDPGAVQVLDRWFKPDRRGVNGGGGFASGTMEPRLGEDGTLSVVFPNGASEGDGLLHRNRFEVIKNGKLTPLGNNVYQYDGGSYRPGDEWFEVWLGEPPQGRLLFVGTPTGATMDPSTITLSLGDPYWTLKKTRETAAGFFNNAPRDAFEHYTQVWASFLADDFTPNQRAFTWNTALQDTSDGLWTYQRVESDFAAVPGTVRMRPGVAGTNTRALLRGNAARPLSVGWNGTDKHVRFEATFILPTAAFAGIGMGIGFFKPSDSSLPYYISFNGTSWVTFSRSYGAEETATVAATWTPTTSVTMAVEIRRRWAYFYVDGMLVSVMDAADVDSVVPAVFYDSSDASQYIYVEDALCRRLRPFLMRGTDPGDYRLPGAPAPGGLRGDYYDWTDQSTRYTTTARYVNRIFNPTLPPYANRIDPQPWLPTYDTNQTSLAGIPTGATGTYCGCRWTGAIYLDLDNYDYRLRQIADDRARVWVGKTRFGEQLIDDWPTAGGHAMTVTTSQYLKGGAALGGTTGPLYGQKSGWYPIVIEYTNDGGTGGYVLQYERSDQPGAWLLVGAPGIGHSITAKGPLHYWPLMDGMCRQSSNTVYDMVPSSPANSTGFNGNVGWGTLVGSPAMDFNGADTGFGTGNWTWPVAAYSIHMWIQPDAIPGAGGVFDVLAKDQTAAIQQAANGVIQFAHYNGGWITLASANNVIAAGGVYHVVATFDGTTKRLYVNNTLVASAAASAPTNNAGAGTTIGAGFPGSWQLFFNGRMNHVAVFNRALSQAEVTDLYNAGMSPQVHAKLAPIGTYADAVRYESHYDQIAKLRDAWALQFRCEPRSLESGLFPCEMVPRVRVGRDTTKVLDDIEAVSVQTQIDASGVADALIGDGSGVSEPTGKAGINAEAFDFTQIGNHLFVHQEYESLGDISFESLLVQRLTSLLALRGSPWEQVQAQPRGFRELLDKFPLAGQLATFAWEPGDGARLSQPEIGVQDNTPRQIMGVSRDFVPDGLGPPSVSFRQRPRGLADTLRKMLKTSLQSQRNYQGSVSRYPGAIGSSGDAAGQDSYARLTLPADLKKVVRLWFNVFLKADASVWNIEINGTNRTTFSQVGRYDITPYIGRAGGNRHEMYAQATGGTGAVEYCLEIEMAH